MSFRDYFFQALIVIICIFVIRYGINGIRRKKINVPFFNTVEHAFPLTLIYEGSWAFVPSIFIIYFGTLPLLIGAGRLVSYLMGKEYTFEMIALIIIISAVITIIAMFSIYFRNQLVQRK